MAKPCRYQLPGEDTWMSESEFKKALNDGLIDKYIGEGTIAIRNFKPRAQAAPVVEAPAVEAPVAEVKEVKIPKNKKERIDAALKGDMVYHRFGDTIYESTPEQYEAALKEIAETGSISDASNIGKEISSKQAPDPVLHGYGSNLGKISQEDAQYELDQRTQKTAPVSQPKAEAEEEKFFIDGKEVSKEDAIKEMQGQARQETYGFNLSGKKIDYQGTNDQSKRSVDEHNKSVSPFNSEGKLKSNYIDAAIRDAMSKVSFRKFGNAYRKHIDPSFARKNNETRDGGKVGKNGMSWQELAGYIIGDGRELATEEQFRAFAKELGLEVPTQTTKAETTAPVAEPTLSKKDQEELTQLESDIDYYTMKMEDNQEQIEIEKSNLKEEKERIQKEKAKVRSSKMSKDEKADKLEELDAEFSDIKDDHDDLVEQYQDEIKESKAEIKRAENRKAKLQQKAPAQPKLETQVEPTQAKEPEAEYQKEEPAKQPSKARYQGKSKFGADQEYAVTLDKDGNPTEVKAIINGSEAKSLQIAKIREDKNGKTIITTTDDIISLDKPSVQKETISFEAQKSMNNDMLSKARESNGDYAIIYTRAGDQIPLKLNRVTGKWMAVNGEGKLVEASEAYQQKAKEAVNWTRKDAKIVDLKTSSNGVPTTTRMVFDFSDNTWKKLNEDEQILYSVPKGMQEKAQSKFVEENPKRAAKREKVEKFFNDRKVDENIIMSTIPGLNPKNINRIIDAAKALVLAGMDLTTAINQAANNVLKQLVREKEITQQEADEALIEVYKGDFLLRPELSGIKNELASENAQEVARKGIDKMGVKEALDAGARAIQDGEVNPESLIETFVQGVGRVLTPIETAAMIRYKAGLDNEISDQYVKLASIEDKNSNEAKQVKTEIERLEKKVENYEIMQVTTGYYQSLSFSLRQFMLTSEYNITKLKAEIAAGYDGKIPEDILAKINEANAKLTQLNKDIARLEREKAKLEDSETIESIKNEKTKSSSGKAITSSNGRISISTDKIKEAISKGADTIEDVIEYVREDVKKQYPDATDREIRDAITNYGKVSSNTKSDLQKKIEEIRSIGKKISALEDIQAEKKRRESSKVTGFFAKQRAKNRLRILSDREQELKRQIKEEMSKMPLTEEEIALKEDKRLEAFKKRTEARIKELKQRIADGDFSTKPRPKSLELDEEAKKLNAEREKILFQFEEEKAKAKYRQRSDAQVAFDALMSILTLSKSLIASLDFSAPFRQGFVYTMSQDPRKTKKQMQEMFKLMNEENYTNWLADLKASDEYNLIKASKLFVAEPSAELSAREESFMSNLGQYIPVLGKSIKTKSGKEVRVGFDLYGKSERAYSGFLNVLRVQAFMEGATTLKEQGYTMEKNPEVFKAMADFVNNSTGRGTGGRAFENSAAALSAVFFSPRLIKSRLNLFNPVYYYKMPPSVRAIALKRMSKLMATSTMMIALLAIAAAGSGGDDEDDLKIELDPRSSDFAKIRMKDTRIDILGGFQPYFRTFVQAITGEKKDIETGEIKKLNADFGGATKMSVISNLFTNKFSPISRTFYEYLSKYDYQKEADAAKEGKYSAYTDLAVPIYLQGIGDLYDEQGLNILWLTPLSVFGFDVQKYDKNPGKSNPYQNDFEFESFEEFDDFDSEFETSDPFKN